jgi:hypothetical protein
LWSGKAGRWVPGVKVFECICGCLCIEPSSSGRVGCPVFVMLPLDTVWFVEREGRKVGSWGRDVTTCAAVCA